MAKGAAESIIQQLNEALLELVREWGDWFIKQQSPEQEWFAAEIYRYAKLLALANEADAERLKKALAKVQELIKMGPQAKAKRGNGHGFKANPLLPNDGMSNIEFEIPDLAAETNSTGNKQKAKPRLTPQQQLKLKQALKQVIKAQPALKPLLRPTPY